MDEFERIETLLRPLTKGDEAALNLQDDCALLPYKDGYQLAVTKDTIVEHVHFFANTSAWLVARKLLGVNLSDMAAMGAHPRYYFIAAAMNKQCDDAWFKEFTSELNLIQQEYDITLLGGDSTRHDGALVLTLTMMGEVAQGQAFYRASAKEGDAVFVSGTIGDAALGLKVIDKTLNGLSDEDREFLIDRYHVPQPRCELAKQLVGLIKCATDISDGLLADLGHVCHASGVAAEIHFEKVPLSNAVQKALQQDDTLQESVLCGGDDYELVFTVADDKKSEMCKRAAKAGINVTEIGKIVKGSGAHCFDANGDALIYGHKGYIHI